MCSSIHLEEISSLWFGDFTGIITTWRHILNAKSRKDKQGTVQCIDTENILVE